LWRLTVWPLWVLIFQGFLIWFLLSPERALSALSRALAEALEKQKTRTSSKSGTLPAPASMPKDISLSVKNITKRPNTPLH